MPAPYKIICWKSATIVLNGKRVATLKRSDMTTTITTDSQQMIRWQDDWFDGSLYNQTESWVHNEVIMRLEDLEL